MVGALSQENERLQLCELAKGPLGAPTVTPTLLSAGSGINIVPERASLSVDRRVVRPPPGPPRRLQLTAMIASIGTSPCAVR